MKKIIVTSKLLIILFICILCCQFYISNEPDLTQRVLGNWKYASHMYRKVGRYGPKEVDPIKSSLLCFRKDKIYFKDIAFVDTCFYSILHPKAFFDRENKRSSYFLDGPLAIKYSEQQLSRFIRIDLNCQPNGFGIFYLNADTLVLNSTGGVIFFFTKSKIDDSK